jgi:GNAT superfamily N-acetyltransferase
MDFHTLPLRELRADTNLVAYLLTNLTSHPESDMSAMIRDSISKSTAGFAILAQDGGVTVGWVLTYWHDRRRQWACIDVYVYEQRRRRGLARGLVSRVLDLVGVQGLSTVVVSDEPFWRHLWGVGEVVQYGDARCFKYPLGGLREKLAG